NISLRDGSNFETSFRVGLDHSCLFVPIVSEAALQSIKAIPKKGASQDNVLLEYELANSLSRAQRLNIFPVLVGARPKQPLGFNQDIPRFNFEAFGVHAFPAHRSA